VRAAGNQHGMTNESGWTIMASLGVAALPELGRPIVVEFGWIDGRELLSGLQLLAVQAWSRHSKIH
jgi:hypothetical protein